MHRLSHAVLIAVTALGATASVGRAATLSYSFTTNTGYTGTGMFSYDAATAPAVIVESGSGTTATLLSLSLTVFSPAGTLLDSGSAVIAGVSNDAYLGFEYTTASNTLTLLDNNTTASGNDVSYFISNYVDPANVSVTPGSTTFNLFSSTRSTTTAVFLGSASQIVVTPVPEPAMMAVLGPTLLALVGLARRGWSRSRVDDIGPRHTRNERVIRLAGAASEGQPGSRIQNSLFWEPLLPAPVTVVRRTR